MAKTPRSNAKPINDPSEATMPPAAVGSFDEWMNDAAKLAQQQETLLSESMQSFLPLAHGSLVQLCVANIEPLKSEVDVVYNSMNFDPDADIRTLVQWNAGISVTLALLKIKNTKLYPDNSKPPEHQIVECVKMDDDGKIVFPFGFRNLLHYDSFRLNALQQGWIKIHNEQKQLARVTIPSEWDEMTPRERYAFWASIWARQWGAETLRIGMAFKAYAIRPEEKSADGKYQRFKFYKTFKESSTNAIMTADWDIQMKDPEFVKSYVALVKDLREREEALRQQFPPTESGGSASGTYTPAYGTSQQDVGF